MDPDADPDPAIFFLKQLFCLLIFEGTFSKIKSQKEVTKQ
jgi:hypothetical protein